MLKTKVIEKIKPSKKIIELFNSNQLNYTSINGYIQVIERTNIKQVFPIVYYLDNLALCQIVGATQIFDKESFIFFHFPFIIFQEFF